MKALIVLMSITFGILAHAEQEMKVYTCSSPKQDFAVTLYRDSTGQFRRVEINRSGTITKHVPNIPNDSSWITYTDEKGQKMGIVLEFVDLQILKDTSMLVGVIGQANSPHLLRLDRGLGLVCEFEYKVVP